jgi:hypothetical protein
MFLSGLYSSARRKEDGVAGMVKQVDTQDLKSCGRKSVRVRFPLLVRKGSYNAYGPFFVEFSNLRQIHLRHHSLEMTDIYLKSLGLVIDKELENKEW